MKTESQIIKENAAFIPAMLYFVSLLVCPLKIKRPKCRFVVEWGPEVEHGIALSWEPGSGTKFTFNRFVQLVRVFNPKANVRLYGSNKLKVEKSKLIEADCYQKPQRIRREPLPSPQPSPTPIYCIPCADKVYIA